jgi:hypothetical protein
LKTILVYSVIPTLFGVLAVFIWANNKINSVIKSYQKKIEVPLQEIQELNRVGIDLYQFSLNELTLPQNKQYVLEKAIAIYKLDQLFVKNYLNLLKDNKALQKLNAELENNLKIAQEVLERYKKPQKK